MVQYVDSGSRDPNDALGTWLGAELIAPASIKALRVQTGFFGSDALGYFEGALQDLRQSDGHTRFLIGSNDGSTPRAALADLLAVVGAPRAGSKIGIVSYQRGYFHPKVFHIERADGTETAYVGSANLTGAGVASLHVEAGLILDTARRDPQDVLKKIADSIDQWFTTSPAGLYEVAVDTDLDLLIQDQVIDVTPPPRVSRSAISSGRGMGTRAPRRPSLSTLVTTPLLKSRHTPQNAAPSSTPSGQPPTGQAPVPTGVIEERWGKKLSSSDADRKNQGTARGAIPLGQGLRRGEINASTYFRDDMFNSLDWHPTVTRTNESIEEATASIHVTINGTYHGVTDFRVSHDPRRQQGRRNLPTTQLHTAPLAEVLKQVDITGMTLTIDRDDAGEFWLEIA
ncbi:phospholipase D family protein [Dietzia sp.]|uniref:phospholipase D family protein n=1 Tax=Dietzia sp. TaxID=1871616 RepID=UPI002FD9DA33